VKELFLTNNSLIFDLQSYFIAITVRVPIAVVGTDVMALALKGRLLIYALSKVSTCVEILQVLTFP